jgi:hypothetical protein
VTPRGSRGSERADAPRGSALRGVSRDREGRPVTGRAVARDTVPGFDLPLFGPWGRWFPYYGTGFGPSFGFVTFNPWGIYGATRWNWYRHGYWYDPYGYYPFGWDPYYPGYGYGYGSYTYHDERSEEDRNMGSIRLKANAKEARVYIDGALVGTVDDFDGFSDHLELTAGTYAIELRADGYETYSGELVVEASKTLTERVSLKKIQ